ncbi:MAG: hypothetical protein LBC68_09600 [Prevotellaceae bacterium]|nr:hypothetical protein [Prevotellaceae bacterium]
MCLSFSSCSKDDNDEEGGEITQQQFTNMLVGKWKLYAYYAGGWTIVSPDDFGQAYDYGSQYNTFASVFQFNSNGTFSPVYSTWEITGQGSSYAIVNDKISNSYDIRLKGSASETEINLLFRHKIPYMDLGVNMEYDYPDVLRVGIGYRNYIYVRE